MKWRSSAFLHDEVELTFSDLWKLFWGYELKDGACIVRRQR